MTPQPRPGFNRVAEPDVPPELMSRYGPTPFVHHRLGCIGARGTRNRVGWHVVPADDVRGLRECGICLRMPAVRRDLGLPINPRRV